MPRSGLVQRPLQRGVSGLRRHQGLAAQHVDLPLRTPHLGTIPDPADQSGLHLGQRLIVQRTGPRAPRSAPARAHGSSTAPWCAAGPPRAPRHRPASALAHAVGAPGSHRRPTRLGSASVIRSPSASPSDVTDSARPTQRSACTRSCIGVDRQNEAAVSASPKVSYTCAMRAIARARRAGSGSHGSASGARAPSGGTSTSRAVCTASVGLPRRWSASARSSRASNHRAPSNGTACSASATCSHCPCDARRRASTKLTRARAAGPSSARPANFSATTSSRPVSSASATKRRSETSSSRSSSADTACPPSRRQRTSSGAQAVRIRVSEGDGEQPPHRGHLQGVKDASTARDPPQRTGQLFDLSTDALHPSPLRDSTRVRAASRA